MQELHSDDLSPQLNEDEKKSLVQANRNPQLAREIYRGFVRNNKIQAIREMQRLFLIPPQAREDDGEVLTAEPANRPDRDFEF